MSLLVLYAAVLLALVGVALVVPNLVHRFKELGGTAASYGVLSSAYAGAQLVGGILIGFLGDHVMGRKKTLLLSFTGAGISYLIVGLTNTLPLLFLSRIIVGLTKQTMTVSTALVATYTTQKERTQALGRLSSVSTLAFSLGQSLGGFMVGWAGAWLPCVFASSLFAMDFALVALFLPDVSIYMDDCKSANTNPKDRQLNVLNGEPKVSSRRRPDSPARRGSSSPAKRRSKSPATRRSVTSTKRQPAISTSSLSTSKGRKTNQVFDSATSPPGAQSLFARLKRGAKVVRGVLALRLVYGLLMRSAYSMHSLYEAQEWAVTPAISGSLASYMMLLGLVIDSILIGRIVRSVSEEKLLCFALLLSASNSFVETQHRVFAIYAAVHLPLSALAGRVTRTCLSSLFSKAVSVSDQGLALSVLDVCNAAINVIAPLYGGLVLNRVGLARQPVIAFIHYLILLPLTFLTVGGMGCDPSEMKHKQT